MNALERDNRKEADQRLRDAREKYLKNHTERIKLAEMNSALLINEIAMVEDKLSGPLLAKARFVYIFSELLACPSDGWIRKRDLADEFDVTKKTVQKDMQAFREFGLAKVSIGYHPVYGYQPTPKFFQLAEHLQQEEPGIYKTLRRG